MEGPTNKRRLVIREMELRNFKSYAGSQKVGPFHKVCLAKNLQAPGTLLAGFFNKLVVAQSFSSVVGPNGSGKSNVIDAMLFVFGKRAKQVHMLRNWNANSALETAVIASQASMIMLKKGL